MISLKEAICVAMRFGSSWFVAVILSCNYLPFPVLHVISHYGGKRQLPRSGFGRVGSMEESCVRWVQHDLQAPLRDETCGGSSLGKKEPSGNAHGLDRVHRLCLCETREEYDRVCFRLVAFPAPTPTARSYRSRVWYYVLSGFAFKLAAPEW